MSALSNCGSCFHWIPQRKGGGAVEISAAAGVLGECHAHPPIPTAVLTTNGMIIQTSFPMPNSGMWCSEHRPNA